MDGTGILIETRPAFGAAPAPAPVRARRRPQAVGRRALAVGLALLAHGAAFAAVLWARPRPPVVVAPPPIAVELVRPARILPPDPDFPEPSPPPAARTFTPARATVAPPPPAEPAVQIRTAAEAIRTAAEVAPAPAPQPVPTAPAAAPPTPAPVAAAPAPAARPSGAGLDSFKGRIMARLAQVKRYPPAARARREQGAALIRFTLSRAGRVSGVGLERSSGSSVLDREALDTVRRAQPLPKIPAELPDSLPLTVAVEFVLP